MEEKAGLDWFKHAFSFREGFDHNTTQVIYYLNNYVISKHPMVKHHPPIRKTKFLEVLLVKKNS